MRNVFSVLVEGSELESIPYTRVLISLVHIFDLYSYSFGYRGSQVRMERRCWISICRISAAYSHLFQNGSNSRMFMSSAGLTKLTSERSSAFLAWANKRTSTMAEFWFRGFSGVEP